jgi:uncharacterized membrane protein
VLEEQTRSPQVTGWKRDLVLFLDRQIYHLAKHWLAAFNLLLGTYLFLPLLAPMLMAYGTPQLGRLIYTVYRPACHQLPERTFFLFGPRMTYTLQELWALGVIMPNDDIFARQLFLGAAQVGYKMALCERDVAIYGGMLVAGLAFGLVRKRLGPLPLLAFLLCLIPLAIDGGTQLFMLRESNWFLRTLTGGLVGIAAVWMLYPHLETAFADIRVQANEKVHLE